MAEVTDPDLLRQLNGEVTDPAVLSQLNQPAVYPNSRSYDATSAGLLPTGSAEAQAQYSPVAGNNFAQNALLGVGKLDTDVGLGAQQIYADATSPFTGGSLSGQLLQQAANKRAIDAPLMGTAGGKLGMVAGAVPLGFLPGANTYLGAMALGGALGASEPVVTGESRLLNTGAGAGLGVAGKYAGDTLSSWLTQRAAQPFMGWNQKAGNRALAEAVGSDAPQLDQAAIAAAKGRFNQIFGAARSPDVSVPVSDSTLNALENAGGDLNSSSRSALFANDDVKDLITHLGGNPTAEQLGSISSNLGKQAASEMSSKMGDRDLAGALFSVKDHVDQLIGDSITDPELKAEYSAALPEYRTFLSTTRRPALLNSTTGDVNLRNLGNYLQRTDTGFREGTNTTALFQAARYGQASTIGSRPPPPILQPFKFAAYHALNNPVIGAAGGVASRLGAPLAPAIQRGFPPLAFGSEPLLKGLWEQ